MSSKVKYLFRQGPVIGAMLKTAIQGKQGAKAYRGVPPELPQPQSSTAPPRDPGLVRDYIRSVGGDPGFYKGQLPSHLFPQWGFPLLSRVLAGLPYDLTRVLNVGARIELNRPIPADETLRLDASLETLDDNGYRVILKQKLVTSTASAPNALIAEINALIPLKRSEDGKKKERPAAPQDARELDRWRLSKHAGLDFTLLTGDINPIHWLPLLARQSGFKNVILHGFSCLARTIESLNRTLLFGDPGRLSSIEVRFVRPIVLPATVGLFVDGRGGVFVADAPGGPVYMIGEYTLKENGS